MMMNAQGFDIRISRAMLADVEVSLTRPDGLERVGILYCGTMWSNGRTTFLGRKWELIPELATRPRASGHGVEWLAETSKSIIEVATRMAAAVVIIHSHGRFPASFSPPDRATNASLLPVVSRLTHRPAAAIVLGVGQPGGDCWNDTEHTTLGAWTVIGHAIQCEQVGAIDTTDRVRMTRQNAALGRGSDAQLRATKVTIVGVCGGGSHVAQQLAHAGFGTIALIDDERVETSNRGRMVGSRHGDDGRRKVDVIARLITGIDPEIRVDRIKERFPKGAAIAAVVSSDIVVSCVDTFGAREQINLACRRYHVPLVDIGLVIRTTKVGLEMASGQIVVVVPDVACVRCSPLLSDAVLERERRERPAGYDLNPDVEDAQVVSMNGVLASVATNCVLHLVTGYGGAQRPTWWRYDGVADSLAPATSPPRRPGCPACAEQGHGDPRVGLTGI